MGKELYEMIRKISFFFFVGEEKYPLDYFKAKSVIIQLSHLVIFKECVYDSNLFFPFKKKKLLLMDLWKVVNVVANLKLSSIKIK